MPTRPLPLRRLLLPALGLTRLLLAGYGGVYYEECQLIPSRTGSFDTNVWLCAVLGQAPALATVALSLGYLTARAGRLRYYACSLGLALLLAVGGWQLFLLFLSTGATGDPPAYLPVGYSPTIQYLLLLLPLVVVLGGSLGSFWLRRAAAPNGSRL